MAMAWRTATSEEDILDDATVEERERNNSITAPELSNLENVPNFDEPLHQPIAEERARIEELVGKKLVVHAEAGTESSNTFTVDEIPGRLYRFHRWDILTTEDYVPERYAVFLLFRFIYGRC